MILVVLTRLENSNGRQMKMFIAKKKADSFQIHKYHNRLDAARQKVADVKQHSRM